MIKAQAAAMKAPSQDLAECPEGLDPQYLKGRRFEDCWADYNEMGYLIFENVLSAALVARIKAALQPHFTKGGRNVFEGFSSNRVYSLLAKEPEIFSQLVTHPLALAFVDRELGESCLLSALLAINLHPGETVQPWHIDDGHIDVPPPRRTFGVSVFWALDDTTQTNGATEIIPGSHRFDKLPSASGKELLEGEDPTTDPAPRADAVKATMPAGSMMVAKGNLWHRGGANTSQSNRLIVTPQYCAGWARQLENMVLSTPPHIVKSLPKRTQELIGYNIHGAFMGYVDGMHPAKTLEKG